MQTTAARNTIDRAAREAAIASYDAHGIFVSVLDAYQFVSTLWAEADDAVILPKLRPAEFGHDYNRYCRLISEGNQFIMCDVSRKVVA
jgi:hypothetical protein